MDHTVWDRAVWEHSERSMGQTCSCFDGIRRGAAGARPGVAAEDEEQLTAPSAPAATRELVVTAVGSARPVPPQLQRGLPEEEGSSQEDGEPSPLRRNAELGPDGLPSMGSVGHTTGDCKRCAFFPKDRCQNGYNCQFCHFDHEKSRRTGKKKRGGAGSAPPTPSEGGFSVLGSTPLSPGHSLGFPSPHYQASTPLSPSGAPPALLAVAQLAPAEMPHQPPVVTQIGEATASNVGVTPGDPAAPPMPMSWGGAAQMAAGREPVTIEELLLTGGDASARAVTLLGLNGITSQEEQHLWQSQYWHPPPEGPDQWSYYNEYYQQQHAQQEYLASMGSAEMLAPYSAPPQSALLPNPPSLVLPSQMPSVGLGPVQPSSGLNKDSPRSVLLTMCGAWGALAVAGSPDGKELTSEVEKLPRDVPTLSREEILTYRNLRFADAEADAENDKQVPQDDCLDAMKSNRASAKRGGKNGPKRGRAT